MNSISIRFIMKAKKLNRRVDHLQEQVEDIVDILDTKVLRERDEAELMIRLDIIRTLLREAIARRETFNNE